MSRLVNMLEGFTPPGAPFIAVVGFYAYHVTQQSSIESICDEGLTIDQPSNEERAPHGAVFFTDAAQALSIKQQLDDLEMVDPGVILAVWISEGTVVYSDDEMPAGTSYCVPFDIPVDHISIVEDGDPVSGPDFSTCLKSHTPPYGSV